MLSSRKRDAGLEQISRGSDASYGPTAEKWRCLEVALRTRLQDPVETVRSEQVLVRKSPDGISVSVTDERNPDQAG